MPKIYIPVAFAIETYENISPIPPRKNYSIGEIISNLLSVDPFPRVSIRISIL